jgi:predicted aminopeptidase
MTNAHFALISTYHDLVPAFRAMLAKEKQLPAFYQAVRRLAKMDKSARRLAMSPYLPPNSPKPPEDADTTVARTAAPQ